MKKHIIALAVLAALAILPQQALAIGAYFDATLVHTFSDCSQDCTKTADGFKAGVLLGNIGLGAMFYEVEAATNLVYDYHFFEASYLLPVPIVNLTVGAGIGEAGVDAPNLREKGSASSVWFLAGVPVMPLFDIHLGYHMVTAEVDIPLVGPLDIGGTMWSIGATFNF